MATKAKTVEQTSNENDINLLNEESEGNIMSEENTTPTTTTTVPNLERLSNMAKVNFLNTTPKEATQKWDIIGRGITSKENSYGAKTTDEHWIIEANERHSVDGYSLGSDVEQVAIKGDGVFEFVDDLMFRMAKGTELETQALEVYKYRVTDIETTPKYEARLFSVLVVPDTDSIEGGSAYKIKYKLQVQGDPTFGTVTFENGKPVFTAKTNN